MAENEIQIVIKAIDNASQTLDRVEKKLDTNNKSITKSNERLGDSFNRVQGAMLNLGQVAQGIHNIFEISERRTRTLENAQDRLENATIRLKQSNDDLALSIKKVDDIEKKHERDSLTLERAQIRLEEAQREYNKTLWRYGEQSIITRKAALDLKEAQMDLNDAQDMGRVKAKELAQAEQEIIDKQDAVTIANNNVERAQRSLNKTLSDAKWAYVDMSMQAISAAGNLSVLLKNVGPLIGGAGAGGFGGLSAVIGVGGIAATAGVAGALLGLIGVMSLVKVETPEFVKAIDERIKSLEDYKKSADDAEQSLLDMMIQEEKLKKFQYTTGGGGKVTRSDLAPKGDFSIPTPPQFRIAHVGDALIRPGQAPVQFSPNDTIIAAEDMSSLRGGIVINITGDNYGTNPNDIANAIMVRLKRKIAI